jgi:phosphonate transport system substrate-binding protein
MRLERPLKIATFLAPSALPTYQCIADFIAQRLDIPTTLQICNFHDEYDSAQPDIAFLCGLPYVLLREANPNAVEALAAPVLAGERYSGKPIYFSDVIVRAQHSAQTFADLRGGAWAFNEAVSQSGYGITRYHLLRMGETRGFFSRVVNAGWHQKAIQLVAAGIIDGAAIDSQVLALAQRQQPYLQTQIKVIDALGPSTIQPVVARGDLPDAFKADVQSALLALDTDDEARATLERCGFAEFVALADSAYDDIRMMLDACRAANYMEIS